MTNINTTTVNNALRLVLLAASALLLAFMGYIFFNAKPPIGRGDYWVAIGLLIYLSLNFGYLLMNPPGANHGTSNWRIFRLIDLWLDAKESELRQRANKNEK